MYKYIFVLIRMYENFISIVYIYPLFRSSSSNDCLNVNLLINKRFRHNTRRSTHTYVHTQRLRVLFRCLQFLFYYIFEICNKILLTLLENSEYSYLEDNSTLTVIFYIPLLVPILTFSHYFHCVVKNTVLYPKNIWG